MSTNERKLCAEVELNKLILVRPTPLVYYNRLFIDRRDHDEIMGQSETAWHRLLRSNLEFLVGEGLVQPVSYEAFLGQEERDQIRAIGETATADIGSETVRSDLLHAWRHYAEYLDMKANVALRGGSETALVRMFADRENAWRQHQMLASDARDDRFLPIYRQCLWKAEASRRIAARQAAVLHMAREYEPFVVKLDQAAAARSLAEKTDELIQHLFELALPLLGVADKAERVVFFKVRRETLPIYRELCDRLEEIIISFQNRGLSFEEAKTYLGRAWDLGIVALRTHITFSKGLLITAEVLLNAYIKTHAPSAPSIPNEIRTAAEKLAGRPLELASEYSPYPWQALFCSLFNEGEFKRAFKSVSRASGEKASRESSGDMWLDNPDKRPWYVA